MIRKGKKRRIRFLQHIMSQPKARAKNFRAGNLELLQSQSLTARRLCAGRAELLPFLLLAALFFDQVAQLAFHRFERVVDHFLKWFVGTVVLLLFIGDELVPRSHRHVDSTTKRVAFLVSMIVLFNRDIASVDVVAKSFQSSRIFDNDALDCVRLFHSTIADLDWQLHISKLSRNPASEKQNSASNLLQ